MSVWKGWFGVVLLLVIVIVVAWLIGQITAPATYPRCDNRSYVANAIANGSAAGPCVLPNGTLYRP